jgi:hypothetical protein
MRSTALLAALAAACPLVAHAQPAPLSDAAHREVTRRVAAHVTTELSLYSSTIPREIEPGQVQVEVVDEIGGAVLVIARPLAIFHWHGYSVLVSPTGVTPVAGFGESHLASSARLLAVDGDARTTVGIAAALVTAAEAPFGASEVLLGPGSDTTSAESLRRTWVASMPPEWPSPGEHIFPDGRSLVRITALRPKVDTVGQTATPVAYAFLFLPGGMLESAAVRKGAPF